MDIKDLCKKPECSNIEYKSSWYWNFNDPQTTNLDKTRLWGEFIKDFLALTNANLDCFDENRYMIIGFNESTGLFEDSSISEHYLNSFKRDLNEKLHSAITDFSEVKYSIEFEVIDGKNIIIFEIEQPYRLYYLNRDIQTNTLIYRKNTVLYRGDDGNSTGCNENVGVMPQPHVKELEKKIQDKYGSSFTSIKIHKPTTISNTVSSYLDKNKTFAMSKGFPILSDDSKKYFELYELENFMNGDKTYIAFIGDTNLKGSLESLHTTFSQVTKASTKLLLLINKPSDSSFQRRINYVKSTYKNIFRSDNNVEFIDDFGKNIYIKNTYNQCYLVSIIKILNFLLITTHPKLVVMKRKSSLQDL